jgi:LmbE family N-acetylglucosaminyl deacetylase
MAGRRAKRIHVACMQDAGGRAIGGSSGTRGNAAETGQLREREAETWCRVYGSNPRRADGPCMGLANNPRKAAARSDLRSTARDKDEARVRLTGYNPGKEGWKEAAGVQKKD